MNDDFERLVNRFSSEWQAEARKAFARLFELLKDGKKLDVAVDILQAEYPALFTLTGLQPTLVEAACYGYGIAPTVLTAAMYKDWEADLSKSWAADNMKLSKRLHTASIEMRNRIIDTIREQMSRNSSWVQTARALFDGYNADKVINEQALPKYITEVRRATRGSVEQLRAARKAINNIERLARNGAPTKSLKTAYKNLVEAALTGSEKQLENACYVAIQEKSRYVADRIARTEQARAYSDGFFRSVADDEDVVAVRWQLGTRHPVFDICDMYMRADLFGLGAGIYPKDKTPPLPAHPFCLCRLSKVYSLDKKPADQIRRGGDKWLQGMSEVHQNMVLGIEGAKAWRKGDDWRKYMRSWQGVGKADTRLREFEFGALNGALNDKNDPDWKRRKAHADRYYEARRRNGIDAFVNKIHKNTGYPINRLKSIYRHVFFNEYDFSDGRHRFYAHYDMAESFRRLLEGKNIQAHDLILLKHEHLELSIMWKLGYNYERAHSLTNTKYNYGLAHLKWSKQNGNS